MSTELYVGEDAEIRVTVLDETGGVKNLTGGTIAFRIGDVRAESFFFAKAGGFVTNGSDGVIKVELTDTETGSFDVGPYDMQFLATDAASKTQVVFDGPLDVKFTLPES